MSCAASGRCRSVPAEIDGHIVKRGAVFGQTTSF
jgi:hypothetical protein